MNFNWSAILEKATSVGIQILISLLILLISFKLINGLSRRLEKKLVNAKHADKTITKTLIYVCKIALKILVVICLVGYLGIDTSGLSALIASLGVCAGLAVNGTLSNLAGGFLLIITRPFKVDDYISAAGYEGTVEDIRIVTTNIRTLDNKVVYIPNGTLSTSCIVNFTEKGIRRLDLTFSIGYSEDFEKAQRIVLGIMNNHPLVLNEPKATARMIAHSASSIDITARAWVTPENYWETYFSLLEQVKKAFDENSVEIPFTQMDVHIKEK